MAFTVKTYSRPPVEIYGRFLRAAARTACYLLAITCAALSFYGLGAFSHPVLAIWGASALSAAIVVFGAARANSEQNDQRS